MNWLEIPVTLPAWFVIAIQWHGFALGVWFGWMRWRRTC